MNKVMLAALAALTLPAMVLGYSWAVRYDGAGLADKASAIVADPSGNCYVAGFSTGAATGADFLTIKYNSQGDTLWTRRLSSTGSASDRAAAAAFAQSRNLYVTGAATVAGNMDYLTVRYNAATGDTFWTRRYGGTGADVPVALVADAAGAVFIGGSGVFNTRTNAVVVKYDSLGVQQWATRIPARTGDSASGVMALAAGPGGGVYAAGWLRAGTMTDYFVARLRATGETAWVRTYSGTAAGHDSARAAASDAAGNVYVAGTSQNTLTDFDYAILKYDSLGNQSWVMRYNGPGDGDDGAAAAAVDSLGNVYVTGYSTGTGSRYDDYATLSYGPTGTQRWVMRYDAGVQGDDDAQALVLDRVGGVYVTGVSESNNNGEDIYSIKYDTGGAQLWAARYNYNPPNRDDKGVALAVPGPGAVCVTGYSYSPSSDTDYVTIRYVDRDLGVTSILDPTGTVPPLPLAPRVRIFNYGVRSETASVHVEIHEGARRAYSNTVTVYGIGANSSEDVSLPAFVDDSGAYTITCQVTLAGDLNPVNDTMSGTFNIQWTEYPFWLPMPNVLPGPNMKPVKDGGALAYGRYTADNFAVFALKGNNTTEFMRYQTAEDSWYMLDSVPYSPDKKKRIKKGASICYDRYDTLVFCLKAGNTLEFWRYSVIGDSWSQKRDLPLGTALKQKKASGGAGVAFFHDGGTDQDYVYALKGNKTPELWCYHVQGDSWFARRDIPLGTSGKGMGDGSCIVNAGGTLYALKGKYNELYAYDVDLDTWYAKALMPEDSRGATRKKAKLGTAMCYGNGTIYALKGGTCQFWGYGPDFDMWFELESMPRLPSGRPIKGGGALAFGGGVVWAFKGNKTFEFFSYDPGADDDRTIGRAGAATQSAGANRPSERAFSITPNPLRSGFATVRLSAATALWSGGPSRVDIIDATGRVVRSAPCHLRCSATLDLRGLRAGVYMVKLSNRAHTATQKLVVQR